MHRLRFPLAVLFTSTSLLFLVGIVSAGSLSPSTSPGATSYTLSDIYTRLTTNASATSGNHTFAPSGSPAASLRSLTEIYDAIPTIVAATVKTGTIYLGITGTYSGYPGTGWEPNASGDGSTDLTQAACEAASGWYWFEDANGDGDTTDAEDGICVQGTHQAATVSWNGDDNALARDNTYIAAYTCSGNFPNGTVATYGGIDSSGNADTTWNDGDCALCQVDCYDGKKDLPNQGAYTTPVIGVDGFQGPLTPIVLANWKGTRLPTRDDFFGFCGYKDGFAEGDNYKTSCSSDTTLGDSGQMIGRTDECIDLSNSAGWDWIAEQYQTSAARVMGGAACSSFIGYGYVEASFRFRAVFRP